MTITMKRRMVAWLLTMSFISPMGVALGNAWYTHHEQRKSDARWCDLLTSLDTPAQPPTSERAYLIQRKIQKLSRDMGCKK